jgi:hypothetical protein
MSTPSNGVKTEDSKVKLEKDDTSLIDDDDQYEDTGELLFPKQEPNAWLVRTPKELWTGLNALKNTDEKIKIGEVLVWEVPGKGPKVRESILTTSVAHQF